jgi:hypothetical protein
MDEVRTAPSGLVDRVARAIFEARNRHTKRAGSWSDLPSHLGEPYFDEARAAIEAMRVPTEAMITEGCNSGEFEDRGDVVQPHAAKHVYTSMIDAALAEANAERERSS